MAPIPSAVKVGPIVYSVFVGGEEWEQAHLRDQTPGLLGLTESERAQITLPDSLAPGPEREVVLHEVLHAIYQVGGNMIERVERDQLEEDSIRLISPGLLGVLRENPDLVAYLVGD